MSDNERLPKRQPGKAGKTEEKLSGKRDVQKRTSDNGKETEDKADDK